jgi:hypothetical protein
MPRPPFYFYPRGSGARGLSVYGSVRMSDASVDQGWGWNCECVRWKINLI